MQLEFQGWTCSKESHMGFNRYANMSQILVPHNPLLLCLNLCPGNVPLNLTFRPHRISSNTSTEPMQYIYIYTHTHTHTHTYIYSNHHSQFLTNINCCASTSALVSPTHITLVIYYTFPNII